MFRINSFCWMQQLTLRDGSCCICSTRLLEDWLTVFTSFSLPTFAKHCRVENELQKKIINAFFHESWIRCLSRLKQPYQFKNNKYRHGACGDPKLLLWTVTAIAGISHSRWVIPNKIWDMGSLVCCLITFHLYILITFWLYCQIWCW